MPSLAGCLVCGSDRWVVLPGVGPQSMASDWRVLPVPLRKRICPDCGLVSSIAPPPPGLFEGGYSLYAHAASAALREQRRQQLYARWIVHARERAGQSAPPQSVLDVGCGNASLLLALGEQWPSTTLMGCDPSAEAVAHANAAGCRVWQGTSSSLPINLQADLVVSVNVIEHTDDPLAFLRDLKRGLTRDGTLVLICPDGARPGVELLMADHVYSFASSHLREILKRAPARAPPYRVRSAGPRIVSDGHRRQPSGVADAGGPGFGDRRRSCALRTSQRWSALDGLLLSRLGDGGVSCFGVGEAAGLLRAYAPRTWQRVRSCTADELPESSRFGLVPAVPLDQLAGDEPLLLGVRPQDQPGLVERLSSRFARIISWHDLIEA